MKNGDIKIKVSSSSLSEFVKRPLPTDDEVAAFDKYTVDEAKEKEVKDSLAKIYQNDKGERLDNKTLTVKRKRGFLFNFFTFLIVSFVLVGALYAIYNYVYLKINAPAQPVSLSFDAPKEVAAGEEFSYSLSYKNDDNVAMKNIEIKVQYPDSFIFLSSDPAPANANNDTWEIASLGAHRSDIIKITGRLVGPLDSANIISADMIYQPQNFSSEFKKSATFETRINDLGLDFSFINSTSVLVNDINDIMIKFKAKDQNYLNNFRLSLDLPDEVQILNSASTTATSTIPLIQPSGLNSWLISNLGKNENQFDIKFKVKEKKQPTVDFKIKFDLPVLPAGLPAKYYQFYENDINYEIIKSDLNLNVIINASPLDQAVNFGQTLNYSIDYANKGETSMKGVIIMAILESDFLDWQSLTDQSGGKVSDNTISWSQAEIPALAELPSGAAGTIDFSIQLKPQAAIDISKAYQITSYVKYSVLGKSAGGESQSNTIVSKINSDLSLSEQLRYFSDDNIAVGSGPLPPKVGQATSLKVYWTINNSLHELGSLTVSVILPDGVGWDGKNNSSIGSLVYDNVANKVTWLIGSLPVTVAKATADFNISLIPQESDRNKIKVILNDTAVTALDTVTGTPMSKTLKAKTSKLEDDTMVSGDGVVQ